MNRSDLKHILRASKDLTFVANLLRYKLVKPSRIQSLVDSTTGVALRDHLADALALCQAK